MPYHTFSILRNETSDIYALDCIEENLDVVAGRHIWYGNEEMIVGLSTAKSISLDPEATKTELTAQEALKDLASTEYNLRCGEFTDNPPYRAPWQNERKRKTRSQGRRRRRCRSPCSSSCRTRGFVEHS